MLNGYNDLNNIAHLHNVIVWVREKEVLDFWDDVKLEFRSRLDFSCWFWSEY